MSIWELDMNLGHIGEIIYDHHHDSQCQELHAIIQCEVIWF